MQAQALESAVKRFSKLEDAAHEAQLATDIHAVRPVVRVFGCDLSCMTTAAVGVLCCWGLLLK